MQLFCIGNFGIFPNAIYTQLQSSTSSLNKNTDYLNIIYIYILDQVLLFCKSIFGMVLDAIYNFFNGVFWAIPIRTG